MNLDLPTIALAAGLLCLLQTLAFAVLWKMNRVMPGIGWWMGSSASFALGLSFFGLWAGKGNPLTGSVLPTLMHASGVLCFYRGAAVFRGRQTFERWPMLVALGLFGVYGWLAWHHPASPWRPLLTTPLFLLFLLMGVRELWGEKRAGLRFSARYTGLVTVGFCAVLCYRAAVLPWLGKGEVVPLFAQVTPQILTFLGLMAWTSLWTFGVILLINQRQLLEIQLAAEEMEKEHALRAVAERELARIERERAAGRLLDERRKILRDLHDGLGGITANLTLLAGIGQQASVAEKVELFSQIEQLAAEGNHEVRMLLDVFESQETRWADVLHGLRRYAGKLAAAHQLELHWEQRGTVPEGPLSDGLGAISILRAVKEALNNATRHAQAAKLRVILRFFRTTVVVIVQDDGIGYRPGAPRGRGMENMRRRVNELGGRVRVTTQTGTKLTFIIPLRMPPDANLSGVASGENLDRVAP